MTQAEIYKRQRIQLRNIRSVYHDDAENNYTLETDLFLSDLMNSLERGDYNDAN